MKLKGQVLSPSSKTKAGLLFFDRGFTLVELVVILAIIGVLAGTLIPALGKAKALAQRTACLSNLRQLGLSWTLYSGDNDGRLVESYPGNSTANPNPYAWVLGNMQNASDAINPDLIMRGQLFQYNNSLTIYRCPADRGMKVNGKPAQPVRSCSMNAFMGDSSRFGYPTYQAIPGIENVYAPCYAKESDLKRPSALWVLIDEDNRSIGDGFFTFDPTGKQRPTRYPASSLQRHNFGFGMAFADGHSEVWHFSDPSTPVLSANSFSTPTAGNKDFQKLGLVTATPKQ